MHVHNINLGEYGQYKFSEDQSYTRHELSAQTRSIQFNKILFQDSISTILMKNKAYCLAIIEIDPKPNKEKEKFFPVDALSYFQMHNQSNIQLPFIVTGSKIIRIHFAMIRDRNQGFNLLSTIPIDNNKLDTRCRYLADMLLATAAVNPQSKRLLELSRKNLIGQLVNKYMESLINILSENTEKNNLITEKFQELTVQLNEFNYWTEDSIRDFPKNIKFYLNWIEVNCHMQALVNACSYKNITYIKIIEKFFEKIPPELRIDKKIEHQYSLFTEIKNHKNVM